MTKPIKFRGRDAQGNVYFGSFDEDTCTIDCWDVAETIVIERDSVAQLVGVDKYGNEVYEGDLVTDKNGYEGFAALLPIVDDVFVTDVGCCSYFCDKCKLKEARP